MDNTSALRMLERLLELVAGSKGAEGIAAGEAPEILRSASELSEFVDFSVETGAPVARSMFSVSFWLAWQDRLLLYTKLTRDRPRSLFLLILLSHFASLLLLHLSLNNYVHIKTRSEQS